MKNKITYIIITLIVNIYFINQVYSQPWMNEVCYDEYDIQLQASQPDYEIREAYPYVSLGVGPVVIIPNISIGYRERYSQLGWDTALSFSTIGYAHQLSAHVVGHYYLSPFRINSAYLGLGVMGGGFFTNHSDAGCTLSPDFVFGKVLDCQDDSRHFIEMHLGIPTFWMNSKHAHSMYFPLMYIKYGMSF